MCVKLLDKRVRHSRGCNDGSVVSLRLTCSMWPATKGTADPVPRLDFGVGLLVARRSSS